MTTATNHAPAAKPAMQAASPKRAAGHRAKDRPQPATREAQRLATAILEVLAGGRTPNEAAAVLGISPPRYYLLEQRALAGLVVACEPRSKGKQASSQHRMAALEKEVLRLRQECARQQALVRAAQRTIGLAAPPPKASAKPEAKTAGQAAGNKRRKRRPMVRALKAAAAIRAAAVEQDVPSSSGAVLPEVLQKGAASSPSPPAVPSQPAPAMAGG